MSDLHDSAEFLRRYREHEGESIFDDPERRDAKRAGQEWGDRVLIAVTVIAWLLLAAEAVLRLGFGVRTLL
jgi:hypothetical protein